MAFWFFVLASVAGLMLLRVLERSIGLGADELRADLASGLFLLLMLLPGLALAVRRLHDTGRRGWWLLMLLVPVVGELVFLILASLPGQTGANRYGAPPVALQ